MSTSSSQRKVKRTNSFSDSNHGNRYFNGRYGNKYGTHKHLYRHHKKTQRPLRLVDFRSIRYCIAYLIQRCLDLFILIWFFCGNYWVFNTNLNLTDLNNSTKTNTSLEFETKAPRFLETSNLFDTINKSNFITDIQSEYSEKIEFKKTNIWSKLRELGNLRINHINSSMKSMLNETTVTQYNTICYYTAFYQIIASYSVFGLFALMAIGYNIYAIFFPKVKSISRYSSRKR